MRVIDKFIKDYKSHIKLKKLPDFVIFMEEGKVVWQIDFKNKVFEHGKYVYELYHIGTTNYIQIHHSKFDIEKRLKRLLQSLVNKTVDTIIIINGEDQITID